MNCYKKQSALYFIISLEYVKNKLVDYKIKYLYKIMPCVLTTHAGNDSLIIAITYAPLLKSL